MPTPVLYPLINGTRHSFASVEAKVAGQIFPLVEINYNRERKREYLRGNHPDPFGKTLGENEYTADGTWPLAEWNLIQALLQKKAVQGGAQARAGYGNVFFPIYVTYSENGFDTICDVLIGCTLDSAEAAAKQGPSPMLRKSMLNPVKILYNGIDDVTVPLVAPPGS